jgi:hypothetical protein
MSALTFGSKEFIGFPTVLKLGASSPPDLWDAVLSPTGVGTGNFTLICGTVNQFLPTNFISSLPYSGNTYVKLEVTASSGRVTGLTIVADSSPTSAPQVNQGGPPTNFEILVGVIINGVFFKTCQSLNFLAVPQESFRADRDPVVLGLFPQVIYYTWSVTQ